MYLSAFFCIICIVNHLIPSVASKHEDDVAESFSRIKSNEDGNQIDDSIKVESNNNTQPILQNAQPFIQKDGSFVNSDENIDSCPSGVECRKLGGECVKCSFNKSCVYGDPVTLKCEAKKGVNCSGGQHFERSMICRYCYQTEKWEHSCKGYPRCRITGAPRQRYIVNCSVHSEIICLGNRAFQKNILCNWTSGYRWSTALILSITLGGFGADRFYLGHWQEGIGKLFSFGGLGVWTVIDVVLVAIGYVGPADGSLYIW